jgi:haloalkane dehalogenase
LPDYPATSHFATVDGFQLHYIDEGSHDAEPVLMVHGNPTWSFYWRLLVKRLAPTHRAIAIDHIGCGLSDKPAAVPYTLDSRIAHLVEFVRQQDLRRVTLVVHDWGGAIGLGAALQDLQRYRRFVVLNTAAFPPPLFPLRIRICRTPLLGRVALQGMNLFARAAVTMATERRGGLPAEVARGMLAPYDNWQNRRAIYEFVRDIPTRADQPTMQRLVNIEKGLPQIDDGQVLLLWGMRDWCFRPTCLKRFQKIWPTARVVEYPEAGHYVMEDAGESVVSEIQQFLAPC